MRRGYRLLAAAGGLFLAASPACSCPTRLDRKAEPTDPTTRAHTDPDGRALVTHEEDRLPEVWPKLSVDDPPRTEDGIPILEVRVEPSTTHGALEPVDDAWKTLTYAQIQATDAKTSFVAIRNDAQTFSDVVLRGGKLYVDVLQKLSGLPSHPGGCVAANHGSLLLSAPGEAEGYPRTQSAWVLTAAGKLTRHELPPTAGADRECKAWLDDDGRFAVWTSNLARHDGSAFSVKMGRWSRVRTRMPSSQGPRYCFRYCNQHEAEHSDKEGEKLKAALGNCDAEYALLGNWLAGRCRTSGGRVARMKRGSEPEVIDATPEHAYLADDVFLTDDGSVVLELALRMQRYAVWRAGTDSIGPQRTLGSEQLLAKSSPTALIRGLPRSVPPAEVSAHLLGKRIAFGANGSTFGYRSVRRGTQAHRAQLERASKVLLPKGKLSVAGEAVVDMGCGAYVRSPIGWEGMQIHDWDPPTLPALHAAAVTRPKQCRALVSVHALPGNPDLLLGLSRDGTLYAAWLPPPLPLPKGHDPRRDHPPKPLPQQHPKPGTGWFELGPANSVAGIDGTPPPGQDVEFPTQSWQAGGGTVIRVGERSLVLTPHGAWTLPPGSTPMAVETTTPRLYAARGGALVVCDQRCQSIDAGSGETIVAVVPRTSQAVILGFEGGKTAVFRVGERSGTSTPPHPLEAALERTLKRQPTP